MRLLASPPILAIILSISGAATVQETILTAENASIIVPPTSTQFSPPSNNVLLQPADRIPDDLQQFNDFQSELWQTMLPRFQPFISTPPPLSPAMQQRSFLEIIFKNDTRLMKQMERAQFEMYSEMVTVETAVIVANGSTVTVVTQQQLMQYDDLKRQYRDDLGGVFYYGLKWFDGLGKQMRREFNAMDTDGSGAVNWTEYSAYMSQQLNLGLALPADYLRVCEQTETAVRQCFGIDGESQPVTFQQRLDRQHAFCRSGLSWLAAQMRGELAILKVANASTGLNETSGCQERIRDVIMITTPRSAGADSNSAVSTLNINHRLQKRVVAVAAPVAATAFGVFGLMTNPLAIIGLSAIAAFIILVTLSGLARIATHKQNTNLWLKQQQFEAWLYGSPLPPCNTPIIYWSPQCGALNTDRASSCPRGQPYMQGACKGWWKDGGRVCNFVGCQALCVDVVTESCPADIRPFALTYVNGTSAVTQQK